MIQIQVIFIPRFTQLTQHDTNTSHIYTTVYTTDST
jgi:hypothetical protein